MATIKSNRQALKIGLFHLFFNIITIFLGLLFFPFFVRLIITISGHSHLEQQVANAHMLFNVLGVLLFLPFTRVAENIFNKILPDKINVGEVQPKLGLLKREVSK